MIVLLFPLLYISFGVNHPNTSKRSPSCFQAIWDKGLVNLSNALSQSEIYSARNPNDLTMCKSLWIRGLL